MPTNWRRYVLLALAAVLIVGGTLATGLLPSSLPYQVLAGAMIVLGFAMVYVAIGAFDFLR